MTFPSLRRAVLYLVIGAGLVSLVIVRFQAEPVRGVFLVGILFLLAFLLEADRLRQQIPLVPVALLGILGGMEQYFFREGSLSTIGIGVCGAGFFFAAQYLVSRGKLIGAGDIYLGMALGAVFGGPRVLFVLLLSYVLGALIALFLLVTKKIHRQDRLPLGSFLALGSICTLFLDHPWHLIGIR